jgi:hypothetical protein
MAAGGIVRVSAQNMILDVPQGPLLPGRYIRIAVADQGEGIPRDLLLKIFDPFFTTKPKGRGLGLTTSYAIIAKHKGHWRLSLNWDTARRPSSIYLPALTNAPIPPSNGTIGPSKGKGTILFMDDDEAIREFIGETFARLVMR